MGLSLTVGGFGVKYYQDLRYTASKEAKRPIVRSLMFGWVVIVGAITSAAIALLGWGGEEAAVVIFIADLVAFAIYLVLMVSVILGD